jgi:hypothetical protein
MNPKDWLNQYRMIGNILIKEGVWADEVTEDKQARHTQVKDRLKEGKGEIETDGLTGVVQIYVTKGTKHLTNPVFFGQVNTLLDLYETATPEHLVTLPPWYECKRLEIGKDNVFGVLQLTEEFLPKIGQLYKDAWTEAIPTKEIAFFHSCIEGAVCSVLDYMEEKAEEIAGYDRKRVVESVKQASKF